jgi:hypothetical protein
MKLQIKNGVIKQVDHIQMQQKGGTNMKIIKWFPVKKCILVSVAVLMVAGIMACGKSTSTTTSPTTYQLTHSAADAEYILNWDFVVSKCPDIGAYDKISVFAYRGESKQIASGESFSVELNSPAAWASSRFVRTLWTGTNFRSFGITIMFSEDVAGLDELVQMLGFPTQREGDFVTGTIEDEAPMETLQLLLAGNHVVIIIAEVASRDESLFFTKDALSELLSIAKSNISKLELTSLPSNIPARSSQ